MLAPHYDVRQLIGVLSASPDPIFIKGTDNRYKMVNQAFLDTCGLTEAEGKSDVELFSPEMVATIRAHDQRVLGRGEVIRNEEVIQLKGSWRTFFVIKFPLFSEQKKIIAMGGIATDITLRRRAEEDNARLTIRAQAVQEAAAHKSMFLATASHELRTPLGGIVGLAELLGRQQLPAEARELVGLIGSSAQGLLRIVNDLLDLSKMEAGRMDFILRPFCLRDHLRTLIATLKPAASAQRLALACEVDAGVPAWLEGDALRLKQVLTNLLANAIKFTRHGSVGLSVAVGPRPPGARGEAVALRFEVTDTGEGIAASELGAVFTPFYQARRASAGDGAGRGTGLGLPICRSLVAGMGGEMTVESALGVGTTFRFSLPMLPTQAPRPGVDDALATDAATPSVAGRVLLVEDDRVNQTVIGALLRQLGAAFTLAPDGESAVARCLEADFDVILMDCMMPGIDGCEATRRILQAARARPGPPPKVVALTASPMQEERQRCQQAGMVDFLVKPIGVAELRATLLRHVPPAPS